eukprot:6037564-Heterocapsa_arctica.AAC.1
MLAKLRMSPNCLAAYWLSKPGHSSTSIWATSISPCMPLRPTRQTQAVDAERIASFPERKFSSMDLLTAFRPFCARCRCVRVCHFVPAMERRQPVSMIILIV